jgi:hypothetical protein
MCVIFLSAKTIFSVSIVSYLHGKIAERLDSADPAVEGSGSAVGCQI